MIRFNFNSFLLTFRKSPSDIAKLLGTSVRSVTYMIERGTVKPSFLANLETHFGDCSKFIKKSKAA